MVLARELHEKIRNIQIKVESSKRLFSIEEELEGTKDAIHLLTAKFEKLNQALSSNAEPDDELQKIKKIAEASNNVEVVDHTEPDQEEDEEHDTEQDIEEDEEDDDPEPDYDDDDEEEQETEEQIDARQECQLDEILLANQHPKHIDQLIGYNEDKEKLIKANNTKKYDDYAYTWHEDIDRDLKTKLIKRVIVVATINYHLQEKIFYLEVKARDYEKYKSLSGILEQLLITHKSLLDKKYPTQRKLYNYSVGNTLYQFKVRRTEFIFNLIQHFLKLSKLKEKRFN